MILTTLILSLGFIAYNFAIYRLFGILPSVSASYYELRKQKQAGWFRAFLIFLFIGMVFLSSLSHDVNAWPFAVAAAGAVWVYVAAEYNLNKLGEWVHVIGAATLICFPLLGIGLLYGNWWPAYIMGLGFVAQYFTKEFINNPGYWVEILAFVVIIWGLFNG